MNIIPRLQLNFLPFFAVFCLIGCDVTIPTANPNTPEGDSEDNDVDIQQLSRDLPPGYIYLSGKGNINESGSGNGNDYWVDINNADASDTGPGTETQPWKTFKHAVETATAGDTVNVMPGVYEDKTPQEEIPFWFSFKPSNSGENGNPITYRSVVPRAAVLRSSTPRTDVATRHKALAFVGKHDIIFDGFKTIGMVHFNSSTRVNFINGEVTMGSLPWNDPSLLWGISLEHSKDCVIRNNLVHEMAPVFKDGTQYKVHNQAGISLFGGGSAASNNLIEYNELDMSNNVYSGLGNKAGNLNGNVWRNNFVKNAVAGIYSTGSTDGTNYVYDSTYINNVIVNNRYGIYFDYNTKDSKVINNTVVNSARDGFTFVSLNSTNTVFVNNVISNTQKVIATHGYYKTEVDYFLDLFSTADYNQFYQYSSTFAEKEKSPRISLVSFSDYQAKGLDANGLEANPLFINSTGTNPEDFKRSHYPNDGAGGAYSVVRGAYSSDIDIIGNY